MITAEVEERERILKIIREALASYPDHITEQLIAAILKDVS